MFQTRIPQMDPFLLSLERRICLCCFLVELETMLFSFPLKQAWLHHSSLDCFSFHILSLSVFKCKDLCLSITVEQFPPIMSSRSQKWSNFCTSAPWLHSSHCRSSQALQTKHYRDSMELPCAAFSEFYCAGTQAVINGGQFPFSYLMAACWMLSFVAGSIEVIKV